MLRPDYFFDRDQYAGLQSTRSGDAAPVELGNYQGILVRTSRVTVLNNLAGFFGTDAPADVYLLFLGVSDVGQVQLSGHSPFVGIRDGDHLPFAQGAPLTLFRSLEALPKFVDLHIAVVRSLAPTRDVAGAISAALQSPQGVAVVSAIQSAATAANPAVGAVTAISTGLLNLVTDLLSHSKDRQIFYGQGTLERTPEALAIGKKITFGSHGQDRAVIELNVTGVPKE